MIARVCVLLACACNFGVAESWGWRVATAGRIVGGANADIRDHPYQLSMRYRDRHGCGASIIAPKWALSAAHCLEDFTEGDVKELTLVAGSTYRVTGGSRHQVARFITHPDYDRNTTDYDYALLKVESPFPVGSEGVAVVQLATEEPPPGELATVTGWGVLHGSVNNLPNHLQVVRLPLVDRATCQRQHSPYRITERMVCAGYPQGGKDACRGDSGGPLVARGRLLGVVSFGYGCALPNKPGIFSSVPAARDWIREQAHLP